MDPQARNIIQGVLDTAIPPNTNTNDGHYVGTRPPDNLAQFRARCEDNLSSYKANGWSLDELERITLIDQAVTLYTPYYGDWVTKPLDAQAPQAVKDWQKAAREAAK